METWPIIAVSLTVISRHPILSLMIRNLLLVISGLTPVLLSSCTTNSNVIVGGVPAWLAAGAKLDSEPPPYKPDAAIINHESESGPLAFQVITDQRDYKSPPVKKKTSSTSKAQDPIERGSDYRIKRLFR